MKSFFHSQLTALAHLFRIPFSPLSQLKIRVYFKLIDFIKREKYLYRVELLLLQTSMIHDFESCDFRPATNFNNF